MIKLSNSRGQMISQLVWTDTDFDDVEAKRNKSKTNIVIGLENYASCTRYLVGNWLCVFAM